MAHSPEHLLDLVRSWFDRDLTEFELEVARALIRKGERPPYIARYIDMQACAGQKRDQAPVSEQPGLYGGGMR